MKAPPDDATTEVPWRGGARARVAPGPYQWIIDNVPEATTPEARATLYELGAKLCAMLAQCRMAVSGDFPLESEKVRRVKREQGRAAVVKAWDALLGAMDNHLPSRFDVGAALERRGIDAATCFEAMRGVIDGYRLRPGIRRGSAGARGRHGGVRRAFTASVAVEIQRTLAVSEDRAAAITAGMARLDGECVSTGSIRAAMRARRL